MNLVRYSKKYFCLLILGLSILLFACQSVKVQSPRPIATLTPGNVMILTATSTILHTPPNPTTPTFVPTKTSTVLIPTPTWTRPPTLNPTIASDQIQKLLNDKGGCVLPCFWGMVPGKTTWDEVYNFLAPFPLRGGKPSYHQSPTEPSKLSAGFRIYRENNGTIALSVVFENNIIQRMFLGFPYISSFSPSDLVRELGTPKEVMIATYRDTTQEGVDPFYLLVFYPEQGVLAFFDDQAQIVDDYVEMCYRENDAKTNATKLFLWQENQPLSFDQAVTEFSLNQLLPVDKLKTIKEATSMNVEQFASLSKKSASIQCIKTPTKLWKGNYE